MRKEHFNIVDRLHTDVLEDKYGPIHAEVIRHDKYVREAHLVDEKRISRTFAITFFPAEWQQKAVYEINQNIMDGLPIGKAFRAHGYLIRKNVLDVIILKMPPWLRKDFKTRRMYAKARLSEFIAKKERGLPILYGTVAEIYSPDFRPAEVNEVDRMQMNATIDSLEKEGLGISEVWKRLDGKNDWQDVNEKYVKAEKLSSRQIKLFEMKVRKYLEDTRDSSMHKT
jgi:hypothetical protein